MARPNPNRFPAQEKIAKSFVELLSITMKGNSADKNASRALANAVSAFNRGDIGEANRRDFSFAIGAVRAHCMYKPKYRAALLRFAESLDSFTNDSAYDAAVLQAGQAVALAMAPKGKGKAKAA